MDNSAQSATVLYGESVLLRPWRVEDARRYVAARDEEVFRWTTEPRTLTVAEVEAAIEQLSAREDTFGFAIVDRASRALWGNLALVLDKSDTARAEVMYWLAAEGRGRGAATQAVQLVCVWAFEKLGLTEITLQTHRENLRSQRVADRAGFVPQAAPDENGRECDALWFVLRKLPGVSTPG